MVPLRTFLAPGLAVGMLGAGYVFAPQPDAAALPAGPPAPQAAALANAVTPVAAAKPVSALAISRAPVPLAPRTHSTYYVLKDSGTTAGNVSTASTVVGGGVEGDPTSPLDDMKSRGDAQARAAIELDGYKNVRALTKGADGLWHGRAMRGRTEIAVRVDAGGNVSAE